MLLLFVNSCKKDRDQQNKTEDITLLKNWFESHKEQHPTNFIKDLNPDWENTYTSITDGVFALEVNLDKPNAIAFKQSSLNNAKEERAAPQTNIRLVLLKNLITGAMDGCYMALTANSDENLRNLHYKQFTNLNGRVLYFDLKGGFVNGHIYTAGNLSNKLSKGNKSDVNDLLTLNAEGTKPNTSTGANKLMVVDVTNCNTEPIDVYTEKCSSITVGPISDPTYSAIKQPNKGKIMSGTNGNTTCTMVYAETIYLTTCDNLPAAVDGGGGYSGGGSAAGNSNQTAPVDTAMNYKFVKNAKAMCALSKLMENNFYKNILNNFIGASKPIDLTFKIDVITQPPGYQRDANTIPNPATWNANNIDITLAENRIDSLSSIEVAVALLHEGIHAEIFRKLISIQGPANLSSSNFPTLFNLYNQYTINQGYHHEFIANYYVNLISTALKQYDKNKFTIDYYEALAWSGLKGTKAYTDLSTTKKTEITSKLAALLLNRSKTNCNDL